MGIVINEFEVIAAPPPATAPMPKDSAKTESKPVPPTIHELASILRRQAERAERVRAH